MANPKLVYTPAGGTEQTLNFVFPPRELPGYQKVAVRHDNVSTAGVRESVLERTDEFLEFTMEFIKTGTDLANWQAFLDHALTGAAFTYYPDSAQTGWHLPARRHRGGHQVESAGGVHAFAEVEEADSLIG